MKFLAINSSGACVESVLHIDGMTFTRRETAFRNASRVCLLFIEELLNEAGIAPGDLDFIGICVGPGSFTGIRIGLATVRTISQALAVPLVTVTNLEVLAYHNECGDRTAVLTDAANGFVYAAVYEGEDRCEIVSPFVLKREEVASFLSGLKKPFTVIEESPQTDTCGALTASVAAAYKKHGCTPYTRVVPLYIRKPQAEEDAEL